MKQARMLVSDLFDRRTWIYWCDFLISVSIGYAAALMLLRGLVTWPAAIVVYLIAIVAIYRASLFMHEISHMRRGEMRGFKVAWNIIAGIPMLLPSFFYETHREHHNTHHYGTDDDGEYLPFVHSGYRGLIAYFAQVFYLPILTFIRHLFITPISLVHPPTRRWVLQHWSSFVINLKFKRKIRPQDPIALWTAMEVACFFRAAAIPALIVAGIDPWYSILILYSLAIGTLTLNHTRTLAAHRYRSHGETMSLENQLLDSVDIAQTGPLTAALCPVGLRFHALHHLFPGLPYHNLGKAHRRLMEGLPQDHPYRQSVYPTMGAALSELFTAIRESREQRRAAACATGSTGSTGSSPDVDRESSKLRGQRISA